MLPSSQIVKVRFNLGDSELAKKNSCVDIRTSELFQKGIPYPGGPYDAHLGTTDLSYKCLTCRDKKKACPGHSGSLDLNYPVWSALATASGKMWLKVICHKCAKPVFSDNELLVFPAAQRLRLASKIVRRGDIQCVHCGTTHYKIRKDATEPFKLLLMKERDGTFDQVSVLYPDMCHQILSRISDDTVIFMGENPLSHPRKCISYVIPIPSVVIRPDVRKIDGSRSASGDLTAMIRGLIERNEGIPPGLNSSTEAGYAKVSELERQVFDLNNAYFDFVRSSNEKGDSLAHRQKGKQGRIRKNMLGKRIWEIGRSTIRGNATLKVDEVEIPESFARTFQVEEIVQEYNKARLTQYVRNGSTKYPGASRIMKMVNGEVVYEDTDIKKNIELEIGSVVLRDVIDGDICSFNRQPSLTQSSLSGMKVRVNKNPKDQTFGMNPAICAFFNADFDGDAMHVIVNASIAGRNENRETTAAKNWLISFTTSNPAIGQLDDSIIGLAELTRSGVMFDKFHAGLLFQNTSWLPDFEKLFNEKETISGREAIGALFSKTPFSFYRQSEWYKPDIKHLVDYDPEETHVRIENGVYLAGVLDKKSIGKESHGNIYHIVANEHSNTAAMDLIFDMQQMAIARNFIGGYTIGIMDILISEDAKRRADDIISDLIVKSQLITDQLNRGEIVPPIGKTVRERYEELQIATLTIADEFRELVIGDVNHHTNNLFKLIMFGSKGKIEHLISILVANGQKLINGERVRNNFGYYRVSPYFPRFSTEPIARGFISNSYLSGMNSIEYFGNAQAARFDLIAKALTTSVTGEQSRHSINNLNLLLTNNFRSTSKGSMVLQPLYGGTGLDPRRLERVKFPTVFCSDADFEKYRHNDFPAAFEQMRIDRAKYRELFLRIEVASVKEPASDTKYMPVNVERLIDDILREQGKSAKMGDMSAKVARVAEFCANMGYVFVNDIQERIKGKVPDCAISAVWLMQVLVRSYLHPRALESMDEMTLERILQCIKLRYSQALISPGMAVGAFAAQGYSEPLVQYMLDAHHRSSLGGTSRDVMVAAKDTLHTRKRADMKAPRMMIPVIPSIAQDKNKVQELANMMESMELIQFVQSYQIFYERYGAPVHRKYKAEAAYFKEFQKTNPLLTPPGDLLNWCIRLQINRSALILKKMPIDLIVTKIRESFPDFYLVYTPENAPDIYLRIYIRASYFKGEVDLNDIRVVKNTLMKLIVRGISGIVATNVVSFARSEVAADGSVKPMKGVWGISTVGTNLAGVLCMEGVDVYNVHTNCVQEMFDVFGVDAAYHTLIIGLRETVASCNYIHYTIYASEMTSTGRPTSVEAVGLRTRAGTNVFQLMGANAPMTALEMAANKCMTDNMNGITAPLLVGSIPKHGTLYNKFIVDTQFVAANMKTTDSYLDEL